MGSKRHSDGEEFVRLPFKHARLNGSDEKLYTFSNVASWVSARNKDDVIGSFRASFCIPPSVDECKLSSVERKSFAFAFDKDIESSAILSTVTGNICEEESSQESDMRTMPFSFDHHPRKLVPIGRQHQAVIPEWEPYVVAEREQSEKTTLSSVQIGTSFLDSEKCDVRKFLGTCVIQMPDNAGFQGSAEPGYAVSNCACFDSGSVHCVRQHVEEARGSLLKSIGSDKYVDLGFLEMGEVVAHGWSDEEQQVFQEVVYSNPLTLQKNFWHCLSKKLPTRSQRDLVSYYYNVFMLRIRATQNRCHEMEIDSDDDEWHGETSYSSAAHSDEAHGSQLDSALDRDNDNHSDDDDDDHINDYRLKALGIDMQFLHKDMNYTHGYQCINKSAGGCGEISDASGGDYASCINIPYYSSESGSGSKQSDVSSTMCYHTEDNVSGTGTNLGLGLYDSHESLMWGINTFTSALDLLPTCNMIEEIFGSGSCDKKSTDDENLC